MLVKVCDRYRVIIFKPKVIMLTEYLSSEGVPLVLVTSKEK
jgi:hypothetical protein